MVCLRHDTSNGNRIGGIYISVYGENSSYGTCGYPAIAHKFNYQTGSVQTGNQAAAGGYGVGGYCGPCSGYSCQHLTPSNGGSGRGGNAATGCRGAGGSGGVGIYGQGTTGTNGATGFGWPSTTGAKGGTGGSGGSNGTDGGAGASQATANFGGNGGSYGGNGGGSGAACVTLPGQGASGAVRLVWPGNTRSYPSTDVGA